MVTELVGLSDRSGVPVEALSQMLAFLEGWADVDLGAAVPMFAIWGPALPPHPADAARVITQVMALAWGIPLPPDNVD